MKICGFGSAAVDIRITTADYGDGYRDKLLAHDALWTGGGSTANFLTQVSRLGGKATWFGKLGNDLIGTIILDLLKKENIDISYVLIEKDAISPFNLAIYAGAEKRRIAGYLLPNCLNNITEKDIEFYLDGVETDDWILVEIGEIPLPICLSFAEKAKIKGAHIVIDVDLDPIKQTCGTVEEIEALFGICDVLIPNINSLKTLFPDQSIEEIAIGKLSRFKKTVILTLGDKGAAYVEPSGSLVSVPGIKLKDVVDTVGAGDAFHGGVVYGLAMGMTLEDSVRLGNICGGVNCLTFGPREGMMRYEQLAEYGFNSKEL
jgi:2-dehydro-3-deoxygluconokinase